MGGATVFAGSMQMCDHCGKVCGKVHFTSASNGPRSAVCGGGTAEVGRENTCPAVPVGRCFLGYHIRSSVVCGHRTHSTVLMKSLRASPKQHKEGRADVKWRRPPEKSGTVVAAGKSEIGSGRTDLSAAPISLKIGAELAEPSIIAGGPRHQHWLDLDLCRMLDVASLSRSSKTQPIRVGSPI